MAITRAYKEYLKSKRWQAKRQQVFAHYGKKCYACGKRPKVLHVHHVTYERLGHEDIKDLMPLCVPCHRELTRIYRRNRRRGLQRVTMEFVKVKRGGRIQ